MIVKSFRGKKIPSYIKSKSQLIEYVLIEFMDDEPISNSEFVFDLRATRFGSVLFELRDKGFDILTMPARHLKWEEVKEIIDVFLNTDFEGGRHQRRVDKISK